MPLVGVEKVSAGVKVSLVRVELRRYILGLRRVYALEKVSSRVERIYTGIELSTLVRRCF